VTGPTTRIVVVDDHNLFRAGLIELLDSVSEYEITADGATGVEAITLAHEHKPDIVILTMHDDPDLVRGLLDAGATSYLLKSAGRAELIAAINAACRSEDAVLVSVSRRTLMGLGRAAAKPANTALFSRREIEVVQRLAEGGSNRNIAAALYISEATVKRHLANIYAKLDATSRIDAIRKAAQLGIISNTLTGDTPGHGATD
jgi:DNA-binding NarL/FixJ family response regulator